MSDLNERLIADLTEATVDALEAHYGEDINIVMIVVRAGGQVETSTNLEPADYRDFMRFVAQQTAISAYTMEAPETKQ
jgi:hypothetical protein